MSSKGRWAEAEWPLRDAVILERVAPPSERAKKRPGSAVLVGVGRCHGLRLQKREVLQFVHGRDEMLGGQWLAGLRHNS